MPPSRRAKQFAPFDALSGLKEAIAAKEVQTVEQVELTEERKEEINKILVDLRRGEIITLVYYGFQERNYLQKTGTISKIDPYWRTLCLNNVVFYFDEIYDIQFPDS